MSDRKLTAAEVAQLTAQGCVAEDWGRVLVDERFRPDNVCHATFSGDVRLGVFAERHSFGNDGVSLPSGVRHAHLHNVSVGDNALIVNIGEYIANYDIEPRAYLADIGKIRVSGRSAFGNGTEVPVMSETGKRSVAIYEHLTAQEAYIMAFERDTCACEGLRARIADFCAANTCVRGRVGQNARITHCAEITNVMIGSGATISGATLEDGTVGHDCAVSTGVVARHFVVSPHAVVADAAQLDGCFVARGCIIEKQFSATQSLFFANCQMANGEATAVFAGPYTVSHHKASLLIAGMFSFANAGSGSNQSNHNYKTGPVHYGVTDRGLKLASDSYILWPAHIGAFSFVKGRHTAHCDTSAMPFSYLIENNGISYLVPAASVASCGIARDVKKWPQRDVFDANATDNVITEAFSPFTMQRIISAIDILRRLQAAKPTAAEYDFEGCKIRRLSLERGIDRYTMALQAYFQCMRDLLPDNVETDAAGVGEWCDVAGLLLPKTEYARILQSLQQTDFSLDDLHAALHDAHLHYTEYAANWAAQAIQQCEENKNDDAFWLKCKAAADNLAHYQELDRQLDAALITMGDKF